MTRILGCRVLLALASAMLLIAACSSNGGSGTTTTTAGAGSSSGGSDSGGSDSGGNQLSGGSKAGGGASGMSAGCRDRDDCPTPAVPASGSTQCLSPGQAPPALGCGAPMWCGNCSCPPQPLAPTGTGMVCQDSLDCPGPSATEATASLCVEGLCTQCADNSHCPATAPACSSVGGAFASFFQFCTQCMQDSDCSGALPHCQNRYGIGRCVACMAPADCAEGICIDGACVPECSPDKPCGNPLTECNAQGRCGPLACADDSTCPPNTFCHSSGCARRACDADADCDGYCVNSFCYETLGTCHTQYAVP